MNISGFFRKIHFSHFLLAVFFGLGLALFGYLFFQSPILSKREFFYILLLWIIFARLIYLLLTRFLLPRLKDYSPQARRNWVLLSIGVGIFFALVTRPPQIIFLMPKHTLHVTVPAGEAGRTITLTYATTALRDLSFDELHESQDWQRKEKEFTYTGAAPASITWTGRTGDSAQLVFASSSSTAGVQFGWDGVLAPIDSIKPYENEIAQNTTFVTGWENGVIGRIIFGLSAGFLFLVVSLFLVSVKDGKLTATTPTPLKWGYWLLYALPMIAVWVFFLLIFWPGLLNGDTLMQWGQVVTGQYSDAHPLLYTLFIGFLTQIYYSPAPIAIAQILMVSLALAWGLAELEHMGVSRKILWALAALCAILPVNILSTITLRKDAPYSVALLVISIILLKFINTRGIWLKIPWNWLGFGLTLGVLSLTRINGLPVAIGSILLILVVYRHVWRYLAAATGVFVIMLGMMYGPVYSILKVKHVPEFGTVLLLHHIAAHLQAGTPVSSDEASYLSQLAPLDSWNYDCCLANPTMVAIFPGIATENFDLPLLRQDIQKPTRIALDLFLKDPAVDLRHTLCAGQLVWSLGSSCPDRIVVSLRPLSDLVSPVRSYYIPQNDLRIVAKSKLPALIQYANPYLQVFSTGFLHDINYTLAIYLYIAIFCTGLLAFRAKRAIFLLFLAPPVIQSITLFFINISQAYRYQYGVVLIGLLSIGFLFVPNLFLKSSEGGSYPKGSSGERNDSHS